MLYFLDSDMTILTTGAYYFTVSSSGHILPAAVGTATGAAVTGAKLLIYSEPVSVAVASAVGTGTSAGAIAGTIASKTAASAGIGALIGGITAAGMGSVVAGGLAMTTGVLASSQLGLLTVGTSHTTGNEGGHISQDCWKPVIRDTSRDPSKGMILKELLCHPNVSSVEVTNEGSLLQIVIENVWKEKFEIEYVMVLNDDKLYCHARQM